MDSRTGRGCYWARPLAALLALALGVRVWAVEPTTGGAAPGSAGGAATTQARLITTDKGPVGELLRKWAAEGTAAGNGGDWYDNRDRGHSLLDVSPYPQLLSYKYTAEQKQRNEDWGLLPTVRELVVFGNASTAAPAPQGGSNPRTCYVVPNGLQLLYTQYRHNNLYLYPAHHDFHPGHNGIGGAFYGDLFPTNTPYVIISLGSSYTDQPFMKAVASTLAAFRPEVKAKLIAEGLLMPTVQMIFRMSNALVKEPKDYLRGQAHPVVFDGAAVDVLKMVQMAHEMDVGHIPPLAQLEVVQEDSAAAGHDYFDPFPSEVLGTTPCVVARVYRTTAYRRRMVLSAAKSSDLNHLPLTYHWVVLQGDPEKVKINLLNKTGESAEITIAYHDRAPISPGNAIESNRVDIGLFVSNGTYYSAPAFVTSFTLDSEARTYDAQGRLLEIGYGMGESTAAVGNWAAFFGGLKQTPLSPGLRALFEAWDDQEVAALRTVGGEYLAAASKADALEKSLKETESAAAKAAPQIKRQLDATAKQMREDWEFTVKIRDALLAQRQPPLAQALKPWIEARLQTLLADPVFFANYGGKLGPLGAGAEAERKRLLAYGIARPNGDQGLEWLPLLTGERPVTERLTRYQKMMIARFNAEVLASSIPGVRQEFHANLVDYRLTIPKSWRDVYHYTPLPAGASNGWTRFDGNTATDFSAQGEIIETKDDLGRALKVRSVLYERKTPATFNPRSGPDPMPMSFRAGPRSLIYEYKGDHDYTGFRVELTPAATKPGEAPPK